MRDSSSGVERLRIPRGRKSKSVVVLAFVVPVILTSLISHGITSNLWDPIFEGLDVRPPGLLLALHGHIETFSKVPKQFYRLFDAPVSLGPFSSGCRRAAAFVTRMGNFCSNLVRPRSSHFQSVMTRLLERNVWDFGFVVAD
ncbi:hypothetical protein CDL15_Pgr021097 [Punica granatum]|uniref:Uncharacterized protein n=1 Tax=Punica granatum TaxID=22663 RepID=A0A218XM00_PUNGR|nr:hypothetical protein CDL15_Pgr021097 [Punica granatum]